jgi:carbonic anhydrase
MSLRIVVFSLVALLYPSSAAWDYTNNGADWTSLGQCGSGKDQSPIDVPNSISKTGNSTLFLKYPEFKSTIQLYNNGYSLAFTLPETYKGGFGLGKDATDFEKDGASAYRLWQVSFHAPSEHSIEGKKMPLEMQLMHQRVTGGGPETAVIVLFFADAANTYNDFLDAFVTKLPGGTWAEETVKPPPGVPFASIIGGSPFYHYKGSLTVPPCETGVKYFLRQTPLHAANAQLTKFTDALLKTCPPKGNFRIMQTVSDNIVLVPSVDLVQSPETTVKPKTVAASKAHVDPTSGNLPSPDVKEGGGCSHDEYDYYYKEISRIAVGDPPYLIEAKENYLRAMRNHQAAGATYTDAARHSQMKDELYDTAPGYVEKISAKWGKMNADVLEDQAQAKMDTLKDSLTGPFHELLDAFNRFCDENRAARANASANGTSVVGTHMASFAPLTPPDPSDSKPKFQYPKPHVALPTGLGASPFVDGSPSGATGSSVSGVKIAPNLHQADVPPSAISQEANPQTNKVETVQPRSGKVLEITLPISSQNIGDEATFKQNLLDALAKTAQVPPTDLKVTGIQDGNVASVQGTLSTLLQRNLKMKRPVLQSKHA